MRADDEPHDEQLADAIERELTKPLRKLGERMQAALDPEPSASPAGWQGFGEQHEALLETFAQTEPGPQEVVVVEGQRQPSRAAPRRREGAPDRLYPAVEIARVLMALRDDPKCSQRSLTTRALPRSAVRRVIRLDWYGALSLGPRGGLRLLGTNGEFRAAGKEVSLRALERARGLEPLV